MNRISTWACRASMFLCFCANAAQAAQLVYEPFDYPVGSLGAGNGGVGFASSWSADSNLNVASGNLVHGSTIGVGNSAMINTNLPTYSNRSFNFQSGATGTDLWVSFVERADSVGSYAGLELTSAIGYGVVIGVDGQTAAGQATTTWALDSTYAHGQLVTSNVPIVSGAPTLLVAHFHFLDGPDQVSLFVNPSLSTTPTIADAIKSDADLVINGIAIQSLQAKFGLDEIRLGTTFADVIGVPEPSAWLLGICGLVGLVCFGAKRFVFRGGPLSDARVHCGV